jgi:hypothetical protein
MSVTPKIIMPNRFIVSINIRTAGLIEKRPLPRAVGAIVALFFLQPAAFLLNPGT